MNKKFRTTPAYIILLLLLAFFISRLGRSVPQVEEVSFSTLVNYIQDGKVEKISQRGAVISASLKDKKKLKHFSQRIVSTLTTLRKKLTIKKLNI